MKRTEFTQAQAVRPRVEALRRVLLRWYAQHRRDLPWRRTQDPYAIWVSEIMLQQTRVDVVVPYYQRFLERFPNISQLAAAPLDEVLQLWAGLGYYSRARNLHRAAQQIVDTHGGRFPREADEIRALPGIGPYTAGAIGSMAFSQRVPLVDGNVMRVLSRFFALRDRIDTTQAKAQFWEWASWWADCKRPGDANQALMELGATVCQPASPDCDHCAVAALCDAYELDLQEELPVRNKRRASEVVELAALLLRRRGRLLLVRRRQGRLLRDFWEMPTVRLRTAHKEKIDERHLRDPLRRHLRISVDAWNEVGEARHSILHHRIHLQVFEGLGNRTSVGAKNDSTGGDKKRRRQVAIEPGGESVLENLSDEVEMRWTTARECRDRALTTLTRKALRAAARHDSSWEQYASHRPAKQPTSKRRDEPAGDHP